MVDYVTHMCSGTGYQATASVAFGRASGLSWVGQEFSHVWWP